jgi:lincosamide nucleotidyltransferase A/C/D/E
LYARLESGPLRPLVTAGPVQRLRRRLSRTLSVADLQEIATVLDGAGGRWWLAGGWGIDALVGRQTRPHGDLDIVLEWSALEPALAALRSAGFAPRRQNVGNTYHHVPGSLMPDREEMQDPAGRTVDLHPVHPDRWLASTPVTEPFAVGVIGQRQYPCLSSDAQRVVRVHYTHGEKDLADLGRLDVLRTERPEPS